MMETRAQHIKVPTTQTNVHPLLLKRWSARSFSDKHLEKEQITRLFEAASWSASSMNAQPWKFMYAQRGTEAFDRMCNCLMEGNRRWAAGGDLMIISLARRNFEGNGKPNRHAMHDVGAANTTLLLQAAQDDIYGHMMGGFHMDQTYETFDIDPEEYEIACFIVLGYLDDANKLEEPFRSREMSPRSRKSISEISEQLN
jgi:nitroreductase